MWNGIVWGFALGVYVFGAMAGLILALVLVGLLSLCGLTVILEITDAVFSWVARILRRLSK